MQTNVKYIDGNIIDLIESGNYDVTTHGCNCFCVMKKGLAPQMAKAFGCHMFPMEGHMHKGKINKLGTIDGGLIQLDNGKLITVYNSYSQFYHARNMPPNMSTPLDYEALRMCLKKINHIHKGQSIILPKIGAGLARGDWSIIESIIREELEDMDVTIVNYKDNK
jgi:O-acetyl-ADP-ribose deacetylase (regulator of RNase III)